MPNEDGRMPVRAEHRELPAVPADPVDQVVTGAIPEPSLHFQTPAALDLLNERVCVVTGPRGVGKTQVAAAYAKRRERDGWLVAWIAAETPALIEAGMVELADALGLYRPEDPTGLVVARVRNHLRARTGPALLVFDNAESLDEIRPHLPTGGTCQVVVTSTVRGSELGVDVPVELFSPEASSRFLREATGIDADASELAAELGHLPLALAQAASRIRRSSWSFARYLEEFRTFPAVENLVRHNGDRHPLSAATAIRLALEPFRDSELVHVLSVLSPDGVPRRLLGDDGALVDLHEASLVEFAGGSAVRMHRLVQRVIRDQGDWVALGAKLLLDHCEFGDLWPRRHSGDELVRQIEALWANTDERQVTKPVLLLRMWEAGFLGSTARSTQACAIAEEVYAVGLARLGDDVDFLLAARQVAAMTGSEDLLDRLRGDLADSRVEYGADHPAALGSARVLGQYCLRTGQAPEAVAVLESALEPWRDRPLDDDVHFGALDDLAHAYSLAGRAEDAVTVLEQSLAARPGVLYTLSVLGVAYGMLNRFEDQRRVCEEVWDGYRRTEGPDHPLTLFAGGKLGTALFMAGEPELARSLLLVVCAIATELFGPDHLIVTTARGALQIIRDA
ncbi:tetratricopeptide repeat protein [Lentzea sp. NPDC003310]|uniref:tetratricopeptide repeat protein n=1 Tax=Lentzea sp. NPDC003310 TaxID=3154447 RepID=UPI00339EB843